MGRKTTAPMPESVAFKHLTDDGRTEWQEVRLDCNGCTACCRDNLIALWPSEGDDLAAYGEAVEWQPNPVDGRVVPFMRHRPDGSCVMLGPQGCTIYDKRPAVCQMFDCREIYREYKAHCSKVQIKQAIRRGGLSRDVFMAGKVRNERTRDS